MTEYLLRFIAGGAIVSVFSILGDMLRPKSFAGLLGAAPSVALATLGIAEIAKEYVALGKRYTPRASVTVSVGGFVPKPHTPFQWFGQNTVEELQRKVSERE